jgi:hypothetical protein
MMNLSRKDILQSIEIERERQQTLFGHEHTNTHATDFIWPSICAEQIGKAFSVLQYIHRQISNGETLSEELIDAYETELIKTAASAVQAIEKVQPLKRQFDKRASNEVP